MDLLRTSYQPKLVQPSQVELLLTHPPKKPIAMIKQTHDKQITKSSPKNKKRSTLDLAYIYGHEPLIKRERRTETNRKNQKEGHFGNFSKSSIHLNPVEKRSLRMKTTR